MAFVSSSENPIPFFDSYAATTPLHPSCYPSTKGPDLILEFWSGARRPDDAALRKSSPFVSLIFLICTVDKILCRHKGQESSSYCWSGGAVNISFLYHWAFQRVWKSGQGHLSMVSPCVLASPVSIVLGLGPAGMDCHQLLPATKDGDR